MGSDDGAEEVGAEMIASTVAQSSMSAKTSVLEVAVTGRRARLYRRGRRRSCGTPGAREGGVGYGLWGSCS